MIISLVDVHTLNLYHNETTELDQRPAYDRFHLKVTLCYTTASNSTMKVTIVRRVFYIPTYFYYANGCIFDKPIYQNWGTKRKNKTNLQKNIYIYNNILTTCEISLYLKKKCLLHFFICISIYFYQKKFQTVSSKSEFTVSNCISLLKQCFQ